MSEENLKRMSNSELLLKQFKKTQEKGNKPGKKTKENELDSYNKFVEKVSEGIKSPLGKGMPIPKILRFDQDAFNKKKLMRRAGASPGKMKAVTGEAMADGGVVDLTTEMVIDE